MSDFLIMNKYDEINPCYGAESFYITKDDINALMQGKKLYTTVAGDEYAITIIMKESEDKNNG